MKLLIGIFIVSTTCMLASCGSDKSLNQSLSDVKEAKQAPLSPSAMQKAFEQCLISEQTKNSRKNFVAIKHGCHASEIAKCRGAEACKADFKSATAEVMARATGVDCDSGYCTILY